MSAREGREFANCREAIIPPPLLEELIFRYFRYRSPGRFRNRGFAARENFHENFAPRCGECCQIFPGDVAHYEARAFGRRSDYFLSKRDEERERERERERVIYPQPVGVNQFATGARALARGNFHRGACGCDGRAEGFTNPRGWAFAHGHYRLHANARDA